MSYEQEITETQERISFTQLRREKLLKILGSEEAVKKFLEEEAKKRMLTTDEMKEIAIEYIKKLREDPSRIHQTIEYRGKLPLDVILVDVPMNPKLEYNEQTGSFRLTTFAQGEPILLWIQSEDMAKKLSSLTGKMVIVAGKYKAIVREDVTIKSLNVRGFIDVDLILDEIGRSE